MKSRLCTNSQLASSNKPMLCRYCTVVTWSRLSWVSPSNSKEAAQNLTMWHLVWEASQCEVGSGTAHSQAMELWSIMQRARICPHFALWNAGAPDFCLNDMLDLWPDLSRIPQDGAASIEPQQQLQPPSKRLRQRT